MNEQERTDGLAARADAANEPAVRSRISMIAILVISLIGVGIAADLANIYVSSRTDPDFQTFCAVSDGINCTSVALSNFSTILNTPVALWAMAGYLFAAFLAGFSAFRKKIGFGTGFLFLFGCLFTCVSIYLIVIMAFFIHSLCILCLAIDFLNFAFLGLSIYAVRAAGRTIPGAISEDFKDVFRHPSRLVILAVAGFGLLGTAAAVGPNMMNDVEQINIPASGESADSGSAAENQQCGTKPDKAHPQSQHGVSKEGHQWIGAADPVLEIQEFTDYQCPFCRKAHMLVRQAVASKSGVRVYHRHLPLDNKCNPSLTRPFHDRACELSKVAICAGEQGRFWEMNDFLFQHSKEIATKRMSSKSIAERLELNMDKFECCMADDSRFEVMTSDITEGNKRELRGTPAFIINEKVYYGKIPPEVLEAALAGTPE